MDPTETWKNLLRAVVRGEGSDPSDPDDAFEAASALESWRARGGFAPDPEHFDPTLVRRARNGSCNDIDRNLAARILERFNA